MSSSSKNSTQTAASSSAAEDSVQAQQQKVNAAASRAERQVALSKSALNDAHRAFNTAFQGRIDRIQAGQAARFHAIEDPHMARIGKTSLRYDIGDDLDEFNGSAATVLEAKARKITVAALGPFDLVARNRRLNQQIDAAVQQHILEHSKVDVDRVFSFIGVRQLRQLRIEFCLCAIENDRFEASGGSVEPHTTEEILQIARDKGIIKPDSEIPVGATEEDMTDEEKANEDALLRSMLLEAAEGGLTTPQFVVLIQRALSASGTFTAPVGSDEYQELEQGLRNLFSVVDADGSGLASWDEVVEYLNHIAEQKKAAESGQTQVLHSVHSVQIKRGPCRRVWTGAEPKHAALWAAQVNTTYDSHVFILHPATLNVDSRLTLPTQISACTWLHMHRGHKDEFLGFAVCDITCHIFFVPCEEAGPAVTPKLPAKVSECTKVHVGRTVTEILWNQDINCLVLCTSDGWVITYNFWELLELNTMARPKFSHKVTTEPITAAVCVRQKVIVGTLTGDLVVCSLIVEAGVERTNPAYHVGQPAKRPGGIRTLHFLPSANLLLCGGDSPDPTAWLLSRIVQHDPIAVIQDQRPNEKPHEAGIVSFFSDPVLFPNRFFTVDRFGMCKEWEVGLLQCVGTSILLVPTAKAPFGSTEITAASNVFDLCKFGRMKGLDAQAPIIVEGENLILPPGTPHLALGAFAFMPTDHSLTFQRMAFVPIEEMRVKERAKSSSSRIACCQYHEGSDKLVATLGCDMAFWHASSGRVSKIFDRLTHCDISAAFLDESGQRVAYGTSDGRCYLYTLVGGKPPLEFRKACDSEITMAWTDGEMCIFAARQGKVLSYCLTSETRDITEAVCDLNFDSGGREFNVGSVTMVENQCVVGDQFGRVVLFDVVPSAGKILTVLSHRKTLTGTLPPAQAAANAAAAQYAKDLEEKETGSDGDEEGDDADEDEKAAVAAAESDGDAGAGAGGDEKKVHQQQQQREDSSTADPGLAERVEKFYHAQRGLEANRHAWEHRQAVQYHNISHYAAAEAQHVTGKVHERLVGLFHLGNTRDSDMMKEIQKEAAGDVKRHRNASASSNNNKKRRSAFHRLIAMQEREVEEGKQRIDEEKRRRGRAGRRRISPHRFLNVPSSSLPGAVSLAESIAAVKASSDRLVYSIAKPSYGEVITISPVDNFPVFAVSNACGDIYITSHSCVEPANVELMRWAGSAPRSVVNSSNKSNVVSMACMAHPKTGRLLLVTGDDAGCISMWDMEESLRFFFNERTQMRLKKRSSSIFLKDGSYSTNSRKGSMILKQRHHEEAGGGRSRRSSIAGAGASTASHPGALGRKASMLKLLNDDSVIKSVDSEEGDSSFIDDDDDDDEEEIIPESLQHNASAMALAAGAKWYLAESEEWLRTPKPQLVACYRVTDGTSITSVNIVPSAGVALIATGEGKILAVNLFTVSSRMEAGTVLGTYIAHKRFTNKAPVGFRSFKTSSSSPFSAAAAALSSEAAVGSLADVLELSSQRAARRWKKIQEYVLGKRIAWYHLTDDVLKKAALEDEVAAQTRLAAAASPSGGAAAASAATGGAGAAGSPIRSPAGKRGRSPGKKRQQQQRALRFQHPDDDVQDDEAWSALIHELMAGGSDEKNAASSPSPNSSKIGAAAAAAAAAQEETSSSTQEGVEAAATTAAVGEEGESDLHVKMQDIAPLVIDEDELDEQERRRREQEQVELRVVRWEYPSAASTPKAKSKKSVLGKQQQVSAKKNKKKRGTSPSSAVNSPGGRGGGESSGADEEDAVDPEERVLEVVRPFQVSAPKLALKLRETLSCVIEDCRAMMQESVSSPPKSASTKTATAEEETAAAAAAAAPFSFVEVMPRPPRLFPPQVSAALTMPCACDVDVVPPPHGVAPEWVRHAIESFQPGATTEGRLVQEDPAASATADEVAEAKRKAEKQMLSSMCGANGEEELSAEATKAAVAAAQAEAAKKAAAERREYEEQLRRRRKTWGNELADWKIELVYDAVEDPSAVGLPSSENYYAPDVHKKKVRALKQEQDELDKMMMRPASAGSARSSAAGVGSGRRRRTAEGRRPSSPSTTTSPTRHGGSRNQLRSSSAQQRNDDLAAGEENGKSTPRFRALTPMLGTSDNILQAREQRERGQRPQLHLFGGLGQWKEQERKRNEQIRRAKMAPTTTPEFQQVFDRAAGRGWPLCEHPLLSQHQDSGSGSHSAGATLLTLSLQKQKQQQQQQKEDAIHGGDNNNPDDHDATARTSTPVEGEKKQPPPISKHQQHHLMQPIRHPNESASLLPDGTKARLQPVLATEGPAADFGKHNADPQLVFGRFSPLVGKGTIWTAQKRSDRSAEFSKLMSRSRSDTSASPAAAGAASAVDVSTVSSSSVQNQKQQQHRTPSTRIQFDDSPAPLFRINEHEVDQKRFVVEDSDPPQRNVASASSVSVSVAGAAGAVVPSTSVGVSAAANNRSRRALPSSSSASSAAAIIVKQHRSTPQPTSVVIPMHHPAAAVGSASSVQRLHQQQQQQGMKLHERRARLERVFGKQQTPGKDAEIDGFKLVGVKKGC